MTTKLPLIELQNVSQTFSSTNEALNVLHEINLEIETGEFVCVIGPSGCGKSTLLKMLAGYLLPTDGSCVMKGESIKGSDKRRGVVFQSPTLYPWLTVEKNIEYGPKMAKIAPKEIKKKSEHYLEAVDLTDFKTAYPFELSGGMKQRVAIARALVNEPELILMDEPFSALDAITRLSMQQLLRKMWYESKQTIFLITHDIEEALKLGTRILVMSKNPGEIIMEKRVDYTNHLLREPNYELLEDPQFQADKLSLLNQIA